MVKKVCFFTRTPLRQLRFEQYSYNDLLILKRLGYHVVVATNIFQIPLDCIFIYSWWVSGSFYPALFSFFFRRPLYVVAGGNEVNLDVDKAYQSLYGFFSYSWIKRLCIRFCLKTSTKIFSVSEYLSASIRTLDSSVYAKTSLLYNSIDISALLEHRITDKPKKFERSSFKVVCIASLDADSLKIKRIPQLIEAFAIARKTNPRLHLVIIGRLSKECSDIHSCLEVLPSFSYTLLFNLKREQVFSEMASCDLYCQPSLVETFGLAAMEAAFLGLPLLLSAAGALPEVYNGKAVFLENPFSVENLSHHILDFSFGNYEYFSHDNDMTFFNKFSLEQRLFSLNSLLPMSLH